MRERERERERERTCVWLAICTFSVTDGFMCLEFSSEYEFTKEGP